MPLFKKIAVCHGKSCSLAGAASIKKILEKQYDASGIEIVERECCGRCEHSCTIVVDGQPISDMSPDNLRALFLDNPEQALADAAKRDDDALAALDTILSDDFLRNDS